MSATSTVRSTASPTRSSAGSKRAGPWSSGRSTPRAAWSAERERLSKHIETVYGHITQLDEKNLSGDGGLLTAVVGFGKDRKALTPTPTADKAEIISAINAVTLDETGFESTFQTVLDVVQKWGHYKDAQGHAYRPMVIVVTDEVGDDEESSRTRHRRRPPRPRCRSTFWGRRRSSAARTAT